MTKHKETPSNEAQNAPETIETVDTVVSTTKEKSDAYKAFEALIEKYKVANPAKYEIKKEALEKKLASL